MTSCETAPTLGTFIGCVLADERRRRCRLGECVRMDPSSAVSE